jgi:phage tail sheath protein FI
VPRGPANEPASGVVDVADRLDDARHDELHLGGVNVFRREPDAVWLTGARSLSGDRQLRHLTVRRLLQLVERALERQLAWTVFEPNDDALRAGLRRMIDHLLEDLFARGAFAGATPAQSWFVHVAAGPALAVEADAGQVIAEIGLALTVPMEYILVRVTLDAAGNVDARGLPGAEVTVHG